jgi:hypothetical protein
MNLLRFQPKTHRTTIRCGWQGSGGASPPGYAPAHASSTRRERARAARAVPATDIHRRAGPHTHTALPWPSSGPPRAGKQARVCGGPLGSSEVRQGAAPVRARCRADGGRNIAWQPSRRRGQSDGDGVAAAARTGPRAAAQTGVHFRPLVREPVVHWTQRRHRLGGVCDGAAVDDGGVGRMAHSPNNPTALSRGCSSAEPTARRSGMAQTTPPVRKARKRGAHGDSSTETRGMPGGVARAARGEPAGELTSRVGGYPPAHDPASAPAVTRSSPLPCVAGSLCPLVCLRIPWQGEAHRDCGSPVQAARLHVAVPRGTARRARISRPAGRRRRCREEAESPPRRLGGSPTAISPERSAYPDGT